MPLEDAVAEWKVLAIAENNRLHQTWNAVVNSASGNALVVDGFSMTPGPVYAAAPADLDRADWRDGGREFDAMLWLVEGGDVNAEFEIRNKKSGLWLGGLDAAKGTVRQVASPVRWRGVMMGDGSLQLFFACAAAPEGNPGGPAFGRLGQTSTGATYPRGKVAVADDTKDTSDADFEWVFRPLDYRAHAFAPFGLKKADSSLGTHGRNLLIAGRVAKSIGAFSKNVMDASGDNSMKQIGAGVAAAFTLVEGVTTFVGDMLGVAQAERNKEVEDPVVQLYEALLPEISRIVGEKIDAAFVEDHIGTAMGMDKTGRDHLRTAARLMAKRLGPAAQDATSYASPAEFAAATGMASPEALLSSDYDLVRSELEAADAAFREARNYLFERIARYAYFPIWMSIATNDLIAQTLRLLVDPVGKADLARETILGLRDDAGTQYKSLLEDRLDLIDMRQKTDSYYRTGRTFALPPDDYKAFVRRLLDQSFGDPPAYLAQIDAVLAAFPEPA